jgi:hypothetical protein
VDIVDVGKQRADLDYAKDSSKASYLDGLLNNKREIMLARALELVGKLQARWPPVRIPPELLYTIGSQELVDGHLAGAEKLFREALDEGSADTIQLASHRSLGLLYMTPHTPLTDLAKGRQQFDGVIKSLAEKNDDNSIFQRGYTYDVWGGLEFLNDQVPEGKAAYRKAEKEYAALSPANSARQASINALAAHKAGNFRGTAAATAVMGRLQGTWKGGEGATGLHPKSETGN